MGTSKKRPVCDLDGSFAPIIKKEFLEVACYVKEIRLPICTAGKRFFYFPNRGRATRLYSSIVKMLIIAPLIRFSGATHRITKPVTSLMEA